VRDVETEMKKRVTKEFLSGLKLTFIEWPQGNMSVFFYDFEIFFSNPDTEAQCVDLYSHCSQQD
jgi:hypothetical protein